MLKHPSYSLETNISAAGLVGVVFVTFPLRGNNIDLPIPEKIQELYYNNSTSLVDGYVISFLTNTVLTQVNESLYKYTRNLSENSLIKRFANFTNDRHKAINCISSLFSATVVTLNETQDYVGTGDLMDVPFGIAGALMHMGVRCFSVKNYEQEIKEYLEDS